jgi:hypothetical protein
MNAQEMAFNAVAIGTSPATTLQTEKGGERERDAHHEEGQRRVKVNPSRHSSSDVLVVARGVFFVRLAGISSSSYDVCAKGRSRRSTLRSSGGRCVRCCCSRHRALSSVP